ncbi:MAG: endo-1,4-beta-xylanase [Planctomycetota bacterium]
MRMAAVCALLVCVSAIVLAQEKELIENGGLEGLFSNGMPKGWQKNCYGINETVFSEETGNVHGGKSALKVQCTSFDGGAVQFLSPLSVRKGRFYRCSFWLRAEGGVERVAALLRRGPPPYTRLVGREFTPSAEWQRFTFEGISLSDEDRAGFFVHFQPAGGGTIWLDDVSVIETDPAEVIESGTPPTHNVIPNSSFEICPWRDWRVVNGEGVLDDDAAVGSKSLRVKWSGAGCQIRSRLMKFATGGREFTLSASIKGRGLSGDVQIALMPGVVITGQRPQIPLTAAPAPEWKRHSVAEKILPSLNGYFYLRIILPPAEDGVLWLDGLCLRAGGAVQPYSAAAPIEYTLSAEKTANIFRQGEPVKITLDAHNDSDAPANHDMVCRVMNFWNEEVAQAPIVISVQEKATLTTAVTLSGDKMGVYRAELTRRGEQEALAALCFSVLPPVNPTPAIESNVGGHFRLDEFHMQVANRTGIKWTRIHDASTVTHWQTAEPEKGTFRWFDEEVDLVKKHGVEILGEFLRVPEWASSAPQETPGHEKRLFPPRNMDEYRNYVKTVVSHYKDRIHHWEIWNEPYGSGFFRGTPEQYAQLAQATVKAVKETDPNCTLLGPCTCGHVPEWTKKVIAAGGLNGVDIFSYHGYGMVGFPAYGRITEFAGQSRRPPLPIWNTETGDTSESFYTNMDDEYLDSYVRWLSANPWDQVAALTVRYYVLALAGGAEKYFQYWSVYEEGLLPRLPAMSIFEYDGSLRPFGVAYVVAVSLLDGSKFHKRVEASKQVEAYVFAAHDGKAIAVLFANNVPMGKTVPVSIAVEKARVRDIMGNEQPVENGATALGRMPVYVIAECAPDDLAGALR